MFHMPQRAVCATCRTTKWGVKLSTAGKACTSPCARFATASPENSRAVIACISALDDSSMEVVPN